MAEITELLLILVVLVDLYALAASRLGALIRIVALQGIVLGIVPLVADPSELTLRSAVLAVLSLAGEAYAVSVRDEIERHTDIDLQRSSVYVTLDRLERKGYVVSRFGDPTPERGGKAKRYFTVTWVGKRALASATDAVDRMRRATPLRSRA